jgi:hypothetical protein
MRKARKENKIRNFYLDGHLLARIKTIKTLKENKLKEPTHSTLLDYLNLIEYLVSLMPKDHSHSPYSANNNKRKLR